jgi:hypothetical protein
MVRDNLAGLIEPMRAARELNPLALFTEQNKSSNDRPRDVLKIPALKGRNLRFRLGTTPFVAKQVGLKQRLCRPLSVTIASSCRFSRVVK